jgi:DNA helicase-2/ATP-dependent DNA helicase PcrA
VIAGAGTGKTMTLAHRVAHLIIQGVSPERILLLTFTRRAAQEMTRRVESIVRQTLSGNSGPNTAQGILPIDCYDVTRITWDSIRDSLSSTAEMRQT